MSTDHDRCSEHVAAVAGLAAEMKSIRETTRAGFAGVNHRLDTQNGRLRKLEIVVATIKAKMVTTKMCETIRRLMSATANATWRSYVIPVAVALTVIVLTKIIGG